MSNKDKISPELFLNAIRNKDASVIRRVIADCMPMVLDYVLKNKGTKQDAEDLLADSFIVVFQKARDPNFSIKHAITTYLYAICKNLWLKQLRRRKFRSDENLSDIVEPILTDDVLKVMEKTEKAKLYNEKMQLLDKQSRYILFLFYREKKSYKEITRIMDLNSEGYAKKLKFLAQKKLIQLIKTDPRYQELIT